MPKLFKFVCIGLLSIFISVLSFSVYAKNNPGNQGNGGMSKGVGHSGKTNKNFKANKKISKFYGHESKKSSLVNSNPKAKFFAKDRETITNFFSTHPFDTNGLPPGIAKNLARGKPLPPGIKKVFLPKDLSDLLGANPDYEYLIAGNDILLVNKTNQIIMDILQNVLH
jgi:hypothetical protein